MANVCFIVSFLIFSLFQVSVSLPFIMLHGISTQCSNELQANFTEILSNLSGSRGYCLEIGNGVADSWFMPLPQQAALACDKVKEMAELRGGYNIVARSQGNLIARGLIEFCDGGPPVYNYVSLGGPQAGISTIPYCSFELVCEEVDRLIASDLYTEFIQDHLAPSNYFKIPTDITRYLESSKYLTKLNNEIPNQRNDIYKNRFASLQNLILVMFLNDTVIIPKISSLFGYYQDGSFDVLLPARQTKLYTEDWIGLKRLDQAGKVQFVSVDGGHVDMSIPDVKKYVVPYLL